MCKRVIVKTKKNRCIRKEIKFFQGRITVSETKLILRKQKEMVNIVQ